MTVTEMVSVFPPIDEAGTFESDLPERKSHRILIYSPDTFGLGHLRRCLKIATAMKQACPNLVVLLLTGNPHAGKYPLPDGIDFVKLPSVGKSADNQYQSRSLALPIQQLIEIRQNIIYETVRSFKPDLMLVDHSPLGVKGELAKALNWIRDEYPVCSLALGLRDIIDEPEEVVPKWQAENIHQALDQIYDRIFIYGTPLVFDPVENYQFSEIARAKTTYTGYITNFESNGGTVAAGAQAPEPASLTRTSSQKEVFLTVGGGEDGGKIVSTYLSMLVRYRDVLKVSTTLVTGPFFPESAGRALESVGESLDLEIHQFLPDLSSNLARADLVVSMGGYNTVTEMLLLAHKGLIIPRTCPRKEQLIRATRLQEMGLVRKITPEQLNINTLYEEIASLIGSDEQPLTEARRRQTLPLDGSTRLVADCLNLASSPEEMIA